MKVQMGFDFFILQAEGVPDASFLKTQVVDKLSDRYSNGAPKWVAITQVPAQAKDIPVCPEIRFLLVRVDEQGNLIKEEEVTALDPQSPPTNQLMQ